MLTRLDMNRESKEEERDQNRYWINTAGGSNHVSCHFRLPKELYIASSSSWTWDETTSPFTISCTTVLIFRVLLGSKGKKTKQKKGVMITANQLSTQSLFFNLSFSSNLDFWKWLPSQTKWVFFSGNEIHPILSCVQIKIISPSISVFPSSFLFLSVQGLAK